MEPFKNFEDANAAAMQYSQKMAEDESIPQAVIDLLHAATIKLSPVDRVCQSAEVIYCNRHQFDDEGKTLGVRLTAFAISNSFQRIGTEERGMGVINALRRDMGHERVLGEWPDPSEDPEANSKYTAPEEEEVPLEDDVEFEAEAEVEAE